MTPLFGYPYVPLVHKGRIVGSISVAEMPLGKSAPPLKIEAGLPFDGLYLLITCLPESAAGASLSALEPGDEVLVYVQPDEDMDALEPLLGGIRRMQKTSLSASAEEQTQDKHH